MSQANRSPLTIGYDMTDYKDIIIAELDVLRKKEAQDKQNFKARAYAKVISQVQGIPHSITGWQDLEAVKGIGAKIRTKIDEIFATGALNAAAVVRQASHFDATEELLKVYGIGAVKAKQLVEQNGIKSLDDLRANQHLLNEKQKIGLRYVDDLQHRIPREEMLAHERKIKRIVSSVSNDFEMSIVGSFRRGAPDSGDIDVLLRLPESYNATSAAQLFTKVCTTMMETNYISDVLALGPKKCMAVCSLCEDMFARRIDLLLTPWHEYPYALLYFTGSDKFNVAMRKVALSKGYSMNEHGMKKTKTDAPDIPKMKDERDIFAFLDIPYHPPPKRDTMKNL